MQTTDAQVRKLMEEHSRHGQVGLAAMRAGMDPKTARKYLAEGKLPSELKQPRSWRTREDPFDDQDWQEIVSRLKAAPELEAKTLFDDLMERKPGRYEPGQLRTLQRRIKQWLATEGPPREVFFSQQHRPGEAMQTDFTWATELGVTIAGEEFRHMLCHPVLPYSNWEWATVCMSESLLALKRGVQQAVFRLGRVPEFHQTDNSTGATHDLPSGKRGFNDEYVALMKHLGMKPRTIEIGEKQQNGDTEALHRSLKRRLEQHLLLRGSRDFESVDDYERWVQGIAEKANRHRCTKVAEELAVMRPLQVSRLPEFTEVDVPVSEGSTIRVLHNTYSVPSRLRGERVRVRVYERQLAVWYGGKEQFSVERLRGRNGHRIDYRHIIWSLVQKPGAFARYRYREDMFPSLTFRRAYDALSAWRSGTRGDLEYLRVLHLAASTMETEVEQALQLLLEQGAMPTSDQVRALVSSSRPEVPEMAAPTVTLGEYDALLVAGGEVAS